MTLSALEFYDSIVAEAGGDIEAADGYFWTCVHDMDEDLREEISDIGYPDIDNDPRGFLRCYCRMHKQRFGRVFQCI